MSRRPPALSSVAVLCLVAAVLASSLASTAGAAAPYGSHVFQANPLVVAGAQSYQVFGGSTVAQSLLVTRTYLLENVTLRVVNDGNATNALSISIHPDDPSTHLPVMSTVLASWSQVTPNNDPTPVAGNWTFSPPPLLRAGQTYWIVATNAAPQNVSGYRWFSTNGDTYAGGHALLDSSSGWSGLPYDMYFITFGQDYDANVGVAMTSNLAQAQPGGPATFTVSFNNTGSLPAPRVWVNDTLPSALGSASLFFPDLQPLSAAAFPNLVFVNVTNGPHSFRVTAQVAIGTRPGTVVTNRVSLAYENATGAITRPGSAQVSLIVGLATKQLYLAGTPSPPLLLTTVTPASPSPQTSSILPGAPRADFVLAPALASPFRARNVTATLWLGALLPPPQTYHLSLSLLDNGTAVASVNSSFPITAPGPQRCTFAFALSNYSFTTDHRIGLGVTNLGGLGGSTDSLVVSYNGTPDPSRLDLITDTYISIQGLTLENQLGPTTLWSTLDSLVVRANVSDPFGEGRIAGARINVTGPSGQLAASGPMSVLSVDPSGLPAWELFGYTLAPPLETGTYRVLVNATEDNGVSTLAEGWANVSVPSFNLANTPSRDRAVTGDTFAFFVDYNNSGTAAAGWVWINNTLPAGLAFITSSLVVSSVSGSVYTWALRDVPVGPHRLEIDARVTGSGISWVQDQATLDARDMSRHPLPTLRSNANLFLNGPIIALSLSSVPSGTVHPNQTVTYRIALVNSGAAALRLWLNDTLPAGFAFQSTTAGSLNGAWTPSGSVVAFTFSGMPANTTWTFDLVATTGPVLIRNATYSNDASLAYTSLTGDVMPYASGSAALTAAAPWIPSVSIGFLLTQVMAGATAAAQISFNNVGNEAASRAWVNVTLDPRVAMANASTGYATSLGTATFPLTGLGLGLHRIYMNLSVSAAAPDRAVLTVLAALDSQDAIGNQLQGTDLYQASISVTTARISLLITPPAPRLEVGIAAPLTVSASNAGTDTAANVWLNLTLPTPLEYVNDTAPSPPTVSGFDYSWHWVDEAPGPVSFQIYFEPRTTTANGTAVALAFHLDYQDSALRPRPAASFTVTATVVAPDLSLAVSTSAGNVVSGATLKYTLTMKNRGMTTARVVYLVDSVDPRLRVIVEDSPVRSTVTNGTYNWTFDSVAPGRTEVINLTVLVTDGVPAGAIIPNVFEATYTNSAGMILGRVRSSPATITVVTDLMPLAWAGLGTAALALLGFLGLRRRRVEIEEVFLVYRDGVLISHLSRTLLREKDEDVLSGMLTAVQEFVREAFQYGEHRDLHQLDFGDYRILIERGKYVFLAVVYSGKESLTIRKKVRSVIDRVEREFGSALENWDGDMERVIGARDLIRDTLLGSSNHNHAAKTAAESE